MQCAGCVGGELLTVVPSSCCWLLTTVIPCCCCCCYRNLQQQQPAIPDLSFNLRRPVLLHRWQLYPPAREDKTLVECVQNLSDGLLEKCNFDYMSCLLYLEVKLNSKAGLFFFSFFVPLCVSFCNVCFTWGFRIAKNTSEWSKVDLDMWKVSFVVMSFEQWFCILLSDLNFA